MNGTNGGDGSQTSPSVDPEESRDAGTGVIATPTVDDASGFGVTMTLALGVLLALGYYGVRGVLEFGFGQAVPAPFYLLALALLFVLELARTRTFDARNLARAVGITLGFGSLLVLAVEGAAFLAVRPEAALDEFRGVAVLAVAVVVAALAYVGYLAAVEAARRPESA